MDEAAPDIDEAAPPPSQGPGGAVLPGPLDFRPGPWLQGNADVADDVVALALASAKVYTFLSIDYPGAAQSEIWDLDAGAAVGMFVFDPSADGDRYRRCRSRRCRCQSNRYRRCRSRRCWRRHFALAPAVAKDGLHLHLRLGWPDSHRPESTESFATGIDTDGRIVGWYVGLDGVRRGFVKMATPSTTDTSAVQLKSLVSAMADGSWAASSMPVARRIRR